MTQTRPHKGRHLRTLPTSYVVIDIETTGLRPEDSEIIEIAALRVEDGVPTERFSTLVRPTCRNTSWDVARFEICAHKWVDLSESDYGVALLNDCKYGHGASDEEISLTLIKTSHYPDEMADIGEHRFSYALFPHSGDWREGGVISEAYKFNIPAEALCGARGRQTRPLIRLEGKGAVVEAVKPAEDGEGTIVRLYECFGGRRTVKLTPGFAFTSAEAVNILEEREEELPVADSAVELTLRPYQILSIRFR